jgi:diaminohydroxyphosphoribosylaminopyrimidine deaminase/5-amino-6-(5-phosphoribosylamino)uracil reductase
VDDPALTVRPPHARARPYLRIVVCGAEPVEASSDVFVAQEGYERTIVLTPFGARGAFEGLRDVADVLYVGETIKRRLDLRAAMRELRARGICSVLCEGGPRLAAALLADGLVDRLYWAMAPRLLGGPQAVSALAGVDLQRAALRFEGAERVGPDLVITGTACLAD